jgi:hypothetical protein
VSAGVTVDAGKAVMRIPALDETLDDLLLHRAPQPARFAKLLPMPHRALPQRACARVARPVKATAHRRPAGTRTFPPSPRFAARSHSGRNAPAAQRSRNKRTASSGLPQIAAQSPATTGPWFASSTA